jgi:hypothetical protein
MAETESARQMTRTMQLTPTCSTRKPSGTQLRSCWPPGSLSAAEPADKRLYRPSAEPLDQLPLHVRFGSQAEVRAEADIVQISSVKTYCANFTGALSNVWR